MCIYNHIVQDSPPITEHPSVCVCTNVCVCVSNLMPYSSLLCVYACARSLLVT